MGRIPTTCCSCNTIVSWVCRVCWAFALLACWVCLTLCWVGDGGSMPSEAKMNFLYPFSLVRYWRETDFWCWRVFWEGGSKRASPDITCGCGQWIVRIYFLLSLIGSKYTLSTAVVQAIKVAARRSLEDYVMCHTHASKYSLNLFDLELNRVSLSHCWGLRFYLLLLAKICRFTKGYSTKINDIFGN